MRKLIALLFLFAFASAGAQNYVGNRFFINDFFRLRGDTINEISQDGTFASPTHYRLPTQKAVYDYVNFVASSTGTGVDTINGMYGRKMWIVRGTTGADYNIANSGDTVYVNIPYTGSGVAGLINTGAQNIPGNKTILSHTGPFSHALNLFQPVSAIGAGTGVRMYNGVGDLGILEAYQNASGSEMQLKVLDASNVSTTLLYLVGGTGYIGAGTASPTAKIDIKTDGLGVTQTTGSGLALTNTTAATSGNPQISPAIRQRGNAFATGSSKTVEFDFYVLPSGSSAYGQWVLRSSVDGGAWTDRMLVGSDGWVYAHSFLSPNDGVSQGGFYVQNPQGAFSSSGTVTITSGNYYDYYANRQFSPTSGTGTFSTFYTTNTINQTGGANGTVRGVYLNHTLTNAADYRGFSLGTTIAYGASANKWKGVDLQYTINNSGAQTDTATAIYLNSIETALNSMVHNWIDLRSTGSPKFVVNSAGDLKRIKGVAYTWPSANAAGVLTSDVSGVLSWTASALTIVSDSAWSKLGNAGTVAGTNFIGTTDNISLVFKTNNSQRATILNTGEVGVNIVTPLSRLHVANTGLGTAITATSGVLVSNETAAAAGAQQHSAPVVLRARGWKTDATAASQTVDFLLYVEAVQGTAAPTGNFVIRRSINGGATSEVFRVNHNGAGNFPSGLTAVLFTGPLESATGGISANFVVRSAFASADAPGLVGAASTHYRSAFGGTTTATITANLSAAGTFFGSAAATEAATGTHPLFTTVAIRPMTITAGAGGLDNTAALYLEGAATAGTNNYTIWSDAGNNRLDGKNGLGGVVTPTALLHLAAGTTAANTGPMKYTSGPLMTAAEAGSQEYNDVFYQTKGSGLRYSMGGTIADFYTDVSNGTTVETDLYSYTTPASTLAADGSKISGTFAGTFNDVTATGQLQVYFGGTVIANTGALTISATGGWEAEFLIIRTGATTARATVSIRTPGATVALYTNETDITGLTLSGTNIIKITGTAGGGGATSGDITAKLGSIRWDGVAAN